MRRTLPVAILMTALAFTASAKERAEPASETAGKAPVADASLKRQFDELEYKYEVDKDADYKLVFEVSESQDKRTQLVYVRSSVETFGTHKIREVWSPGYQSKGKGFPAAVANRLLEATQDSKLGAWAKQGEYAVFVVKLPAEASTKELDDAIDAALRSADGMEAELTPGKDEF